MAEQIDPMDALKTILAQLNENQTAQLKEFAAELRKPTAREQKKLDEEEARVVRTQNERLALAKAQIDAKAANARACGHIRVHPGTGVTKHLWRAQVHTPAGQTPYFVPTCQGCLTQTGRIPATTDMLRDGVNLDQYPMLTEQDLRKWAEQYAA